MVLTVRPDVDYVNNDTVVPGSIPFNSPESPIAMRNQENVQKGLYQQLLSDLDSAGKQDILITCSVNQVS